jgi:hypothetical protein
MELAEDGSEDVTSTPPNQDAGMVTLWPNNKDADMVPPGPTMQDAGTVPPAPPGRGAGTTPDKSTDPKHKGTTNLNLPSTPRFESSSSNDDDAEDADYFSCFVQWPGVDPDCPRIVHDEEKMFAHHDRLIGN